MLFRLNLRYLTGNLTVNRSGLLKLNESNRFNLNVKCSTNNKPLNDLNDDGDMPINIKNPYKEEKPCCILCKYNLEVNYKNPRLLSQFISSYTGLLYDRNITGLCAKQYDAVKYHIKIAQWLNLMPRFYKNPLYKNDPKLFNPFKPIRETNV